MEEGGGLIYDSVKREFFDRFMTNLCALPIYQVDNIFNKIHNYKLS
jgi:hypothetical protein